MEERVRYYCSSCEACICPICVTEDHRGHAFDVLEKAVQEHKKNIMLAVDTIKEKANLFRAELRKLEKTLEDVEMIIAIAKQEVSEATEHVIIKTRRQEKQLFRVSRNDAYRRRMERINSAKQELKSLIKKNNQAAEVAENLVQLRSAADIIQNKHKLRQKLEELHGVELPKHHRATFVKFAAASQHNFKLGFVQVTERPAIAAKSTLEGLEETFQAGVEAKFTLCPRTSGGEISDFADREDQVELLITPAKDVTNVTVDEKYDGNVRLKFTPKVPGAHSVEVRIDGDKLLTCPMTVQVKERELVVVGELKLKLFQGDMIERLSEITVNTEGQIVVTDTFGHYVYVFDKMATV